jgi:tetratricopeptide (TPR) repeat protein
LQRKQQFTIYGTWVIYLQACAFIEGLGYEDQEGALLGGHLPSWHNILASNAAKNSDFLLMYSSQQYTRAFLFEKYDKLPEEGVLDRVLEGIGHPRPMNLYGILFEALVAFRLLRQTEQDIYRRKGEAALAFMRKWSECNKWNFENKYLLLEGEMMHSSGYYEQASQFYERSIISARTHKFVHEEAIACEVAANFYYKRGIHQKAYSFFAHSIVCYKKWGALAIASRVEQDVRTKFGSAIMQILPVGDILETILAPEEESTKRSSD